MKFYIGAYISGVPQNPYGLARSYIMFVCLTIMAKVASARTLLTLDQEDRSLGLIQQIENAVEDRLRRQSETDALRRLLIMSLGDQPVTRHSAKQPNTTRQNSLDQYIDWQSELRPRPESGNSEDLLTTLEEMIRQLDISNPTKKEKRSGARVLHRMCSAGCKIQSCKNYCSY